MPIDHEDAPYGHIAVSSRYAAIRRALLEKHGACRCGYMDCNLPDDELDEASHLGCSMFERCDDDSFCQTMRCARHQRRDRQDVIFAEAPTTLCEF